MDQLSLDFENQDYYYFFMKVGHGNCFLPLARQMGGLWVAYMEEDIPQVNDQGLCTSNTAPADLQYMTVVTQKHLRNKIRIVTYGKDSLLVWEPTAELQKLNMTDHKIDWSDSDLYSTFPSQWHKEMKHKYGRVGSPQFIDGFLMGKMGAKMIPVNLSRIIPRATLLASVDSLSVWQSLNRKTFQPIFTLHGNKILNDLEWLKKYESLPPLRISENRILEEGSFGKFIRLYLGGYFDKEESLFRLLSRRELSKTALSILNPAQLETAVMHLCRDLGLTIDVAHGKGLDVVDVKATVRHLPRNERSSRLSHALSTLEKTGVRFSAALRCEIQATSTFRIQCKSYSDVDQRNLGNTLLAVPTLRNINDKTRDCLELERVSQMSHKLFPELFGWLNLLESDLRYRPVEA